MYLKNQITATYIVWYLDIHKHICICKHTHTSTHKHMHTNARARAHLQTHTHARSTCLPALCCPGMRCLRTDAALTLRLAPGLDLGTRALKDASNALWRHKSDVRGRRRGGYFWTFCLDGALALRARPLSPLACPPLPILPLYPFIPSTLPLTCCSLSSSLSFSLSSPFFLFPFLFLLSPLHLLFCLQSLSLKIFFSITFSLYRLPSTFLLHLICIHNRSNITWIAYIIIFIVSSPSIHTNHAFSTHCLSFFHER